MTTTLDRDEYLAGIHSGNFDHLEYLVQVIDSIPENDVWTPDDYLLKTPASRRAITRNDPLLFALVYCRELLTDDEESMSFADLHLELCRYARTWRNRVKPRDGRSAFVAPREAGKSSWVFKILPLWAAAHEHVRFVAAFSSSATQAQKHLAGFKRQLDMNPKLRQDFPRLTNPAKRPSGGNVSDSQEMLHTVSGFSFTAAGLDSEILGLVDPMNRRPDLILLDDVEPDESNYSAYQAKKRLTTITDTVLAMNERAHVALVGTVTMPGSLVHQLVKTVTTKDEVPEWIKAERFEGNVHYLDAIIPTEDGGERSIWPHKWPIEYLSSIRHTRSYKKNFQNQPVREDGDYWTPEDFVYQDVQASKVLLQIDPAVTDKKTSDFYGLAVIAYQPPYKDSKGKLVYPKCAVRYAKAVKLPPAKLRQVVLRLLQAFPEIGAVRIEVNQGGDTWRSVLHDLPVKLLVHTESVPKKVRASNTLNHYQRGRVSHAKPLPELEEQMTAFPNVLNDDMVDAVGAGVHYFFKPKKKASVSNHLYAKEVA